MILYDLSYNYRNYILTLSYDNPQINLIVRRPLGIWKIWAPWLWWGRIGVPLTINQSINHQSAFAKAPVTGDHWHRTSNLIKSIDKNQW